MPDEEEFRLASPNEEDRCLCDHMRNQHILYREKCDNCGCRKFQWAGMSKELQEDLKGDLCVMPEKPVIVGYQWHRFQGTDNLCQGIIGDGSRKVCNQTKDARIHSEELNPFKESGLKDSGERLQFSSGMVRDIEDNKPGFHFLIPKDVPMNEQMLTRVAEHLRKGAKKYTPRNWEKGDSNEEAERARESALRHLMQWIMGETDEDHAAAVITNVIFAETMQYKANKKKEV